MKDQPSLDALVDALLNDPRHADNPLREPLEQLYRRSLERMARLDRVTRLSSGLQTAVLDFDAQLRRFEKIARISDRYQALLHVDNHSLRRAATHDLLTGLGNRRLLSEHLADVTEHVQRGAAPYTLLLLDVDNFKQINDTWGHEIGDQVLIEISRKLKSLTRENDFCARWGGEEFVVLLPRTPLAQARPMIERMHGELMMNLPLGQISLLITLSLGATEYRVSETWEQTLQRADKAMLQAKRSGRSRYVLD